MANDTNSTDRRTPTPADVARRKAASAADVADAMATWDTDGQNDPTGNDAGEEQAFGHDSRAEGHDPDAVTDPERALRPSTTGRTGPN